MAKGGAERLKEGRKMKRFKIFVFSIVLVLGVTGVVGATTFTLDTYNVALNNSDPGLVLQWAPLQTIPFSFDLNVGDSTTFNLFKIWTNETTVNNDDRVEKPISVSMNFTAPPPPFGGEIPGDTFGGNIWIHFPINEQFGRVEWDGPITFIFGDVGTGQLVISLSDETFNYGWYGLTEGPCFGALVEATATYVSATVPEPTTMLLLGLGLLSVAGIRRRIR